jgi:hypothetical protein
MYNFLAKFSGTLSLRKNSSPIGTIQKLPRCPVALSPSHSQEGEKLVGRLTQYVVQGGEKRREVKTFPLTSETSVAQVSSLSLSFSPPSLSSSSFSFFASFFKILSHHMETRSFWLRCLDE